jgi:hypothetical protein
MPSGGVVSATTTSLEASADESGGDGVPLRRRAARATRRRTRAPLIGE